MENQNEVIEEKKDISKVIKFNCPMGMYEKIDSVADNYKIPFYRVIQYLLDKHLMSEDFTTLDFWKMKEITLDEKPNYFYTKSAKLVVDWVMSLPTQTVAVDYLILCRRDILGLDDVDLIMESLKLGILTDQLTIETKNSFGTIKEYVIYAPIEMNEKKIKREKEMLKKLKAKYEQ